MVYLGLPIKNGDYPWLCEIPRWYMFPKFGGNMCIDAKVADDTQEKTSRFAQANLNALQVCSTEILVAPISGGQSSLSLRNLQFGGCSPLLDKPSQSHIAMRLQHATFFLSGSRMISAKHADTPQGTST
jgi:hypothetical protein